MIGRLIEDSWLLGRFIWFYHQAPKRMHSPGFHNTVQPTLKARAKWAWLKTTNQI